MTERLYYDDPTLLAFDAAVTACVAHAGGYRVALDRSAFYPTSGGQPHDVGQFRIAGRAVPVTGVVAGEDGEVWHQVAEPLAPGLRVAAEIDRPRRDDFRQQHSGQHILSASFDNTAGARTESVHLGIDACTLDLHLEVTPDQCRRAEDHANEVVWQDRPIVVRYADAADLADEPRLRKATTRAGRVRLVDIEGHDLSACGGTHVQRTGEVGIIAIRGIERFRGGTRVTFLCGRRVLASYRELRDGIDAAARTLSSSAADVPAAIVRLRDDLKQEQRRAREAADRLIAAQAEALAARVDAEGRFVADLPDADPGALRAAALQLVSSPGRVVALIGGPTPHALVIARSADRSDVDAGALVRALCAAHGGKGGGRPDLAQAGGVDVTLDQLRRSLG